MLQASLSVDFSEDASVQTNFDTMYAVMMRDLLDRFYAEREISVTSSDRKFVTPAVKALLRHNNR